MQAEPDFILRERSSNFLNICQRTRGSRNPTCGECTRVRATHVSLRRRLPVPGELDCTLDVSHVEWHKQPGSRIYNVAFRDCCMEVNQFDSYTTVEFLTIDNCRKSAGFVSIGL